MRHIATLIAAIVIAPAAWIMLAFGQDRSTRAFADAETGGAFHAGDFVGPLQFLAAAGLLLGLIATLRVSPLGAAVTGAGYAASYALLLVSPRLMLEVFDRDLWLGGRHVDPVTPIRTGTALVVGVLLLVAVVSVGRWRRWPRPEYEAYSVVPDHAALGADGLGLLPERRGYEPEMATRTRIG